MTTKTAHRAQEGKVDTKEIIESLEEAYANDSSLEFINEAAKALAKLAAMESQEDLRYTSDGALAECPCCGSLDVGGAHDKAYCHNCGLSVTRPRPLQNAIDAWNTRTRIAKPVPADKPSRITEQDFIEILASYSAYAGADAEMFISSWLSTHEGRALLNKLNADREQVPAVAVPDGWKLAPIFPTTEMIRKGCIARQSPTGEIGDIWNSMLAAAPSHSQQSAATDSERFCDAHCTWRDHHPDCPSHESEQ